jgi:hypothetical protein
MSYKNYLHHLVEYYTRVARRISWLPGILLGIQEDAILLGIEGRKFFNEEIIDFEF